MSLASRLRSLLKSPLSAKPSSSAVPHGLRGARARVGLVIALSLCGVPTTVWVAHSQTTPGAAPGTTKPAPDPNHATISPIHGSTSIHVGEMTPLSFGVTPDVPPVTTSECRLGNGSETPSAWSGPSYEWKYWFVDGADKSVAPAGATQSDGPTHSPSGAPSVSFTTPGNYILHVEVTITYKASCSDGTLEQPETKVLSGQTTLYIHVDPAPTPTPDPGTGDPPGGGTGGGATPTPDPANPIGGGTGDPPGNGSAPPPGQGGGTPPNNPPTNPPNNPPTNPQATTLKATTRSWNTIDVSWSPAPGKLYSSTDPNFKPQDDVNLVLTVPAPAPGDGTPPTNSRSGGGLSPNTTYYYTFVPSDPNYASASAEATTQKLPAPSLTFGVLARACAGGVGVDGVHSFTLTGTASRDDGSGTGQTMLVTGTALKLSFDGNKGHDYSQDDPSLWPDEWTQFQQNPPKDANNNPIPITSLIKKAKFFVTDATGQKLVEETNVTTNDKGQFSVTVLSSDIVSQDIKTKVKWTDTDGKDQDVGSKACDFAAAQAIRRFANPLDEDEPFPEGDNGWLFGEKWLTNPGRETTGKIYLKFMVDPSLGDVDGNWMSVNGHQVLFEIDHIDRKQDATTSATSSDDDCAIVVPSQNGISIHATSEDGAATTIVRAGQNIDQADKIWLSAFDESQWNQ